MAKNSVPEQFSLKWNNFSSSLTSGFLNHLTENDLVDVTLAVEGQLLHAHKLVLSVCSPYFKSIFKENPCQHPVIILKDVTYMEIESLLKFMYQGEINIKQEDLSTFLKVAQMLRIRGLSPDDSNNAKTFFNYDVRSNESNDRNVAQSSLNAINQTSKEMDMIDRRKRSRDITKEYSKKKKNSPLTVEDARKLSNEEEEETDEENVLFLLNRDENETVDEDQDIPIENSSDNIEDEEAIELAEAEGLRENSSQEDVEPVIYKLSARGRPQLVHEGYVYNLTSRSEGLNRSHYRCAEQHRGCKGKCAVIAERFMPTGVHNHNHPPGYQSEHDYRKRKGTDMNTP